MDYLTVLKEVGVGLAAIMTLIFLMSRTVASLIIYKMIGEWDAHAFINGLFKQAILYGVVLVALVLARLFVYFSVSDEVMLTMYGTYYTLLTLVSTFTLGKLSLLVRYAFNEVDDLSDFN